MICRVYNDVDLIKYGLYGNGAFLQYNDSDFLFNITEFDYNFNDSICILNAFSEQFQLLKNSLITEVLLEMLNNIKEYAYKLDLNSLIRKEILFIVENYPKYNFCYKHNTIQYIQNILDDYKYINNKVVTRYNYIDTPSEFNFITKTKIEIINDDMGILDDDKVDDRIQLIVATSLDGVIGYGNELPWRIKSELQHFKKTTLDSVLIMGNTTYKSIPKLTNRYSVVLTGAKRESQLSDVNYVNSITQAVELSKSILANDYNKIFVIGGANVYEQFLSNGLVDVIYHTVINGNYDNNKPNTVKLNMDNYLHSYKLDKLVEENDEFIVIKYVRK